MYKQPSTCWRYETPINGIKTRMRTWYAAPSQLLQLPHTESIVATLKAELAYCCRCLFWMSSSHPTSSSSFINVSLLPPHALCMRVLAYKHLRVVPKCLLSASQVGRLGLSSGLVRINWLGSNASQQNIFLLPRCYWWMSASNSGRCLDSATPRNAVMLERILL